MGDQERSHPRRPTAADLEAIANPVQWDGVIGRISRDAGLPWPAVWIAETVFDGGYRWLEERGFVRMRDDGVELAPIGSMGVDLRDPMKLRLVPVEMAIAFPDDPPAAFEGTFADADPDWFDHAHQRQLLVVLSTPRPLLSYSTVRDVLLASWIAAVPLAVYAGRHGPSTRG
jgi:hypothetical protein